MSSESSSFWMTECAVHASSRCTLTPTNVVCNRGMIGQGLVERVLGSGILLAAWIFIIWTIVSAIPISKSVFFCHAAERDLYHVHQHPTHLQIILLRMTIRRRPAAARRETLKAQYFVPIPACVRCRIFLWIWSCKG
uniref:(northern house mosquito) hypothetical protein n=1 Tax=Culex pipiens TaxID=7175 RepID=A0A8D8K9Q4_CULPI